MARPLNDACSEVDEILSQVDEQCLAMQVLLDEFCKCVSAYSVETLGRKLTILSQWVWLMAEALYRGCKSPGHVRVYMKENEGILVRWVGKQESVATNAWYKSKGWIDISFIELEQDIIEELQRELTLGNWRKVAGFLNKYGKSPGLDFDQFLKNGQ